MWVAKLWLAVVSVALVVLVGTDDPVPSSFGVHHGDGVSRHPQLPGIPSIQKPKKPKNPENPQHSKSRIPRFSGILGNSREFSGTLESREIPRNPEILGCTKES